MLLATPALVEASPAGRIVALDIENTEVYVTSPLPDVGQALIDTTYVGALRPFMSKGTVPSIYQLPYSMRGSAKDWHRLWVNTAVFAGAFVGTLLVLECLPEDATSWNCLVYT